MRRIEVLVSEDAVDAVTDALDAEEIDYVRFRAWSRGEQAWLVSFPIPTDAIGYVRERLTEAGVDDESLMVVTSVETARTPGMAGLQERFATDFDPLTTMELRAKARDMSQDVRSFLAMILLSALIATAGLLLGSPAVIVGSMVIAPMVGPVLTAAVGTNVGDAGMLVDSLRLQTIGLAVAILSAFLFALLLRSTGFVSPNIDIASIDLVAVRLAPGVLTVVVALAAGGAAAIGLATKGPTSLIGVMIAAALIPAAATVGLAAAVQHVRVAVGALALVCVSAVLINLAATVTLRQLGYGSAGWRLEFDAFWRRVATVLVLVSLVLVAGGIAYDQAAHERTVGKAVDGVLADDEYDGVQVISVVVQYGGYAGDDPETVTVHVSHAGTDPPDGLATDLDRSIEAAVDAEVNVRVRSTEYDRTVEVRQRTV